MAVSVHLMLSEEADEIGLSRIEKLSIIFSARKFLIKLDSLLMTDEHNGHLSQKEND